MSDYDGYDDYSRDFEPVPARMAISRFVGRLFDVILAGLTLCVAARWTYLALDPDRSYWGLLVLLIAFTVGAVAAVVMLIVLAKTRDSQRQRWLALRLGIIICFIAGFAIPVMPLLARSERREPSSQPAQEYSSAFYRATQLEAEQRRRRNLGREALRREGLTGAPGTAPTFLAVIDDGTNVSITNHAGQQIKLSVARLRADPAVPGGWRRCELWSRDVGRDTGTARDGDYEFHAYHQPHEFTAEYQLPESCRPTFVGAPLEYRVGDPGIDAPGGILWWTDSALIVPMMKR